MDDWGPQPEALKGTADGVSCSVCDEPADQVRYRTDGGVDFGMCEACLARIRKRYEEKGLLGI